MPRSGLQPPLNTRCKSGRQEAGGTWNMRFNSIGGLISGRNKNLKGLLRRRLQSAPAPSLWRFLCYRSVAVRDKVCSGCYGTAEVHTPAPSFSLWYGPCDQVESIRVVKVECSRPSIISSCLWTSAVDRHSSFTVSLSPGARFGGSARPQHARLWNLGRKNMENMPRKTGDLVQSQHFHMQRISFTKWILKI